MPKVAIYRGQVSAYPVTAPFHPPEDYPEYPFKGKKLTDAGNDVYATVREALALYGFDKENYGTPQWNPLGLYVAPGQRVVIKPNLARHYHHRGFPLETIVTHGSIIRPILDYVFIALQGRGEIVVGDAPLQAGKFDEIVRGNGLEAIVEFMRRQHPSLRMELIDFREERAEKNKYGFIKERIQVAKNGSKSVVVNLGAGSSLVPIEEGYEKFRVTNYDPRKMNAYHAIGHHQYKISRHVLQSDVVVSIPKFKTHKKAGITLALKNLVGINVWKDCLPHHRKGSVEEGGDEYRYAHVGKAIQGWMTDVIESFQSQALHGIGFLVRRGVGAMRLVKPHPDRFREGSWYGNDTLWRTILDLNRILLYADSEGIIKDSQQRRHLCVVDGILGTEGNGPLDGDPRPCGLVLIGENALAVDFTAALLMGFYPERIPTIAHGFESGLFELRDPNGIQLVSNKPQWNSPHGVRAASLEFHPPTGWQNLCS